MDSGESLLIGAIQSEFSQTLPSEFAGSLTLSVAELNFPPNNNARSVISIPLESEVLVDTAFAYSIPCPSTSSPSFKRSSAVTCKPRELGG